MSLIKTLLSTFLFALITTAYATPAQDSLYNNYEQNNTNILSDSNFKQNPGDTFELQTRIHQQKAYKFLFLAGMVFFALLCVLIFVFFYRKISKIHDLTKIHVREIQLRDTRIKNLTLLLTHSSQPMLLMSKTGDLKWMNEAFADYKYFDKEENIEEKNFLKDIASEQAEKPEILEHTDTIQTYRLQVRDKEVKRTLIPITETNNEVSGFALVDYVR
jgi:uncharacterized protein YihD (DUF1040 family)